jgi:hypothetical protein
MLPRNSNRPPWNSDPIYVHSNISILKNAKYHAAKTVQKDGGEGVQHREHKPRLQVIALPLYRPLKSLISPNFPIFKCKTKNFTICFFCQKAMRNAPPPIFQVAAVHKICTFHCSFPLFCKPSLLVLLSVPGEQ